MGKGGRGKGGGKAAIGDDKEAAYFDAIRQQNDDTIFYCLKHAGVTLGVRDDDGKTGLMVASELGKEKSIDQLLRVARQQDRTAAQTALNEKDSEYGMTALMFAAANGHCQIIQDFLNSRANPQLKDKEGLTAWDHAKAQKQNGAVRVLEGKPEESEGEDEASDGVEGENSSQRRKRKKAEMEAKFGAGLKSKKKGEAAEEAGATAASAAPVGDSKPVLDAVAKVLKSAREDAHGKGSAELLLENDEASGTKVLGIEDGHLDPAMWRCADLRRLQVVWKPGLVCAAFDGIAALRKLQILIIRESNLPALPEALGELVELKSLELEGNKLTKFPKSIGKLKTLESISANRNLLTSVAPLAPLSNLMSLALGANKLKSIDELDCGSKLHIHTLCLSSNALEDLPDDIFKLEMLQTLDVSGNKLKELPQSMGQMKEKKLTTLLMDDNPFKDGKIRNMLENSAVLSKDVLPYLRKQKPQKGGGKKKKKVVESEDEEDDDPLPTKDESEDEPPPVEEPVKKGKKSKKDKKKKAESEEDDDPAPTKAESEDEPPPVEESAKKGKKSKKDKKKVAESEDEAPELPAEEFELGKKSKKKKEKKEKKAVESD